MDWQHVQDVFDAFVLWTQAAADHHDTMGLLSEQDNESMDGN